MNEFQIIDTLMEDCESQYEALNEYDDVCWDCYDKENWLNMVNYLQELKKLIKKPKLVTREYGKEL